MDIRFLCLQHGRKYYEVSICGESIFVGTRPECARFMKIHEDKVSADLADAAKAPRSRSVPVRTYRTATRA